MRRNILILTFGLMLSGLIYGQEQNDTTYNSTRLVPRFVLHLQKGYGIEVGLFLNQFNTRFPTHKGNFLPYSSLGFFLTSELRLRDFDNIIIGPKIGWELGVIGETHGSYFGAEFINYTDFEAYSPALMLKIGLPMRWFTIGYGYTMFFEDTLKDEIGKHRITVSYTLNLKANREYKRLQEKLASRL